MLDQQAASRRPASTSCWHADASAPGGRRASARARGTPMIVFLLQFVLAFVLVLGAARVHPRAGALPRRQAAAASACRCSRSDSARASSASAAGETDYRLSLVPLGGYVRLAGDESDEQRHGAPEEFLSRPGWQRLVVFLAGPAFNVTLAFLVMWTFFATFGKVEVPYTVVYRVAPGSEAELAGVERGDKLVAIAGHSVEDARSFQYHYNVEILLAPGTRKTVTLERDGQALRRRDRHGRDPKLGMGDPGWSIGRGGGESPVDRARRARGRRRGSRTAGRRPDARRRRQAHDHRARVAVDPRAQRRADARARRSSATAGRSSSRSDRGRAPRDARSGSISPPRPPPPCAWRSDRPRGEALDGASIRRRRCSSCSSAS